MESEVESISDSKEKEKGGVQRVLSGKERERMSRKIKVINVVLSAPYQIGENSYTNICKTVQLAIPDDGHDWHVYGESGNEFIEQDKSNN